MIWILLKMNIADVSKIHSAAIQYYYILNVADTRAKTKLILVYVNGEWSAGQFAKNINNILGKSGLKMKDVATIANCTECISD